MNDNKKIKKLSGAISPYDYYCAGYGNLKASGSNYITSVVMGKGLCPLKFDKKNFTSLNKSLVFSIAGVENTRFGQSMLDEISAFDSAEIENINFGQINMITVSSFCGLEGLIWGYDIAKHPATEQNHPLLKNFLLKNFDGSYVPVYNLANLKEATLKLFGTINKNKFPLIPGSIVPCAEKNIGAIGPNHIYGGMALAIAKNREKNACLFMEDVGIVKKEKNKFNKKEFIKKILKNLGESTIIVGKNQKIKFEHIFVDAIDLEIPKGMIGSILIAAPYFTLAKKAIPNKKPINLLKNNLSQWEKLVKVNFQ